MASEDRGRMAVTLRLPKELISQIDEIRASQPLSVPRNTWIAEAVLRRVSAEHTERGDRNAKE